MNYPLVYIVVLTWNGKTDTIECLNSLKKIDYPNYKILVVDNASEDGTSEIVRSEFPEIELIINKENLRFAGGNNVGIYYSLQRKSDYILLLNNDTIVDRSFLSQLIESAETNPKIGIVGPKIYFYSEPKRIWYAGGKIEWWKGWISHVGIREIDNGKYETVRETDFITGCCMLIKREVVESIGKLDERYYIYGEDVDYCIRAKAVGYNILFQPKAIIWHKLSVSTGGHLSWFKNWNKLKSQIKIMIRFAKFYHWLTIPFGIIINIVSSYISLKRAKK